MPPVYTSGLEDHAGEGAKPMKRLWPVGWRKKTAIFGAVGLLALLLATGMILASQKPAVPPKAAPSAKAAEAPATQAETSSAQATPKAALMTTADVGAFVDGIVPLQLARGNIAGAVVVVVKDGQIIFQKGYGYADVKTKRHVTPSATLFRVGSISKLFTWTSVMQLVEAGKLNLDRNVNSYLDFRIPATYGQPVTLRDLMTHTPGFEEAVNDLFVPTPKDMVPLASYVKAHLPARIFPPGTVPAYSNYGATLAGYIVQRASGMPFDDYVEKNILTPLGMTHSSFRQPLPGSLRPLMSNGYFTATEEPGKYEIVQAFPAGSLAASGDDIARFMIAQLNEGRYDNARILDPRLDEEMQSRQFGLVPSMNGMCLGFYEESRNGHRIFGHGGDTVFFHSDLHLVPYAGLGFFVSYNSAGRNGAAGQARSYLWHKFLDRYFPYTPPPAASLPNTAADAASVAGSYISSRGWRTSFMKLASVLSEIRVTADADGTIQVSQFKDLNGQVKKWKEVEPMIWRHVDGQGRLAFRRNSAGRWEMVIDFPAVVYTRVSALESGRVVQTVILIVAAIFLLALVLWPVAALVRRHYGRPMQLASAADWRMRRLVKLACAIDFAVLLGWAIFFSVAGRQPGSLNDQIYPFLYLLVGLGILGVLAALLSIYNGFRSWVRRERWWWTRITNLAVALAGIGYLWIVFSTNLLKIGRF
jgi:CubicO group peptidase (beta-lactamase class C family)